MMKKIILISSVAFFFSCSNEGQENQIVSDFFQTLKENGSDEAIENLFATNEWNASSGDQIGTVKDNLSQTISQLGEYYGYELINTIAINKSLVHYTYLVKYDRQPLRFTIVLYKPLDKWQIQNFHYDYNFIEELNEVAKMSRNSSF